MARLYGLNGLIRGRQGNNVFSVQNGTQVLKQYNPAVANPRTPAQQLQRVKFALVGKISSCTPSTALAGLNGGSERSRRAAFVSKMLGITTADATATGYQARALLANFIFSIGSVAKYTGDVTLAASYTSAHVINVTVPAVSYVANTPTGYGELLIVGMFDASGSPLDNIRCVVRQTSGNQQFRFQVNQQVGALAAAWVVPFIAGTRSTGLSSGNLAPNTDNDSVILDSTSLVISAATDWGQTVHLGTVQILVPEGMHASNPNDEMRNIVEDALVETAVQPATESR